MRDVSLRIKSLEKNLADSEEKLQEIILGIPNIPHATVPVGKDSADNPVYKTCGIPRTFDFEPRPHWTIGEHASHF